MVKKLENVETNEPQDQRGKTHRNTKASSTYPALHGSKMPSLCRECTLMALASYPP